MATGFVTSIAILDASDERDKLGLAMRLRLEKHRFQLSSRCRNRDTPGSGNFIETFPPGDCQGDTRLCLRQAEAGTKNSLDVGPATNHTLNPFEIMIFRELLHAGHR
jgi:hypothetical protein